jgi:hypothetical protein
VNKLYTVDTGSRTLIFHPKLYLVRGREHARLIIGSANLTLAGLNNNIEAGMLLDFDLTDAADKAEIDKIEMLFAASLTDYPNHVVEVGNIADLDYLLAANRLFDERVELLSGEAIESDDANSTSEREGDSDSDRDNEIPRIKLKTKFLRRGVAKAGSASKEAEHDTIPAVESEILTIESEPAGQPIPTSEIEVDVGPENTPSLAFRNFRQSRRGGEGPKLRAARLRKEAIAKGRKWYFTGEPCKYGHIKDRLVSNGKCRECNRQDSERSNRLGLYR